MLVVYLAPLAVGIANRLSWSSSTVGSGTSSSSTSNGPRPVETADEANTATPPSSQASVPAAKKIPKLIHHMHEDLDALSPAQRTIIADCKKMHPGWTFVFWDDASIDKFIAANMTSYYPTWVAITPLIKKIDTSRYILMYLLGGVYMDCDVECVTPLDSLIEPLAPGAAWMGDFPDAMFEFSAPGNQYWLYVLEHIKNTYAAIKSPYAATGPGALHVTARNYILQHGAGALLPFVSTRPEPEFHKFIKHKNNTVPWAELANGRWGLESGAELPHNASIWRSPTLGVGKTPSKFFPASKEPIPPEYKIGFAANELVDAGACVEGRTCAGGKCAQRWPYAYVVHQCMSTWHNRID